MGVKRVCFGCAPPDRHVGCHSTCEQYLKEREQAERRYDQNLMNNGISGVMYDAPKRSGGRNMGMDTKRYRGPRREDGQ